MVPRLRILVFCLLAAPLLGLPGVAEAATPFGKLTCVPRDSVRFCEGTINTRVPSFDGVPLDVNVALPGSGEQGFPLTVILPWWGGEKDTFAEMKPWAARGYAVLSYTPRGFYASCGTQESRLMAGSACLFGWLRVADVRREVRDTQYLSGLLVDEGLVDASRIGATGNSYGGGQSLMLSALHDRMFMPDGTIVAWTSPKGAPMRLAAAASLNGWSDFASILAPNGRHVDSAVVHPGESFEPVGVLKQSFAEILFTSGEQTGYYAPAGADESADLPGWYRALTAGEPYADDVQQAMAELSRHHSAAQIPLTKAPPPTLVVNGWSDDVTPFTEALRFYNRVRSQFPSAEVALLGLDVGHGRAADKAADLAIVEQRVVDWFDHFVKGGASSAPFAGVEAFTQTCPKSAPSGGPFRAGTWAAMSPGEVRSVLAEPRTIDSKGGSSSTSLAIDPYKGSGPCAQLTAADDAADLTLRLPPAEGSGFTLLGPPEIRASLRIVGSHPQLAGRLWDVAPDGSTQMLVTRGALRPRADGAIVFQLNPGAWHFAAGHAPKLELLGADAPFLRPSNGTFTIEIRDVDLRLPVLESPQQNGPVQEPEPGDPSPPGAPAPGETGTDGGSQEPSVQEPGSPGETGASTVVGPPQQERGQARSQPERDSRPAPLRAVTVLLRYPRPTRGACGGLRVSFEPRRNYDVRLIEIRASGRRIAKTRQTVRPLRISGRRIHRARTLTVLVRYRNGDERSLVRELRQCRRDGGS